MSRSGGVRERWFSGRGARARTGPAADPVPSAPVTTLDRSERPGGGGRGRGGALLVEEHGGVMLLRSPSDDTLSTSDVADLVRALSADPEHTVTVVAGADASSAGELWPRLGGVLDSLRSDGVGVVRLVLSAAGDDRPDEPAVARRIADAWEVEVIAPDGVALVVPGGGLFVPERRSGRGGERGGGERGGWWRFAPGAEPVRIGSRQPAPAWQPAVEHLPAGTSGGYSVEQIPAGVLVRSRDANPPRPDDLCYAVPADPRGPTVLLGAPQDEDVPAGDLTELLTALPEAVRPRVRLAPGGPRDILRTSQSVADSLGVELVVRTGMPLMSYGSPAEPGTVRSVLVGADGAPRWQSFVDAVVCAPAREGESAPSPRLLRWSPPVPGRGSAEHGAIRLSERWRVTVTRAGLWITDTESEPPPATGRAVDPEGPAIELGHPGQPIDATLYPVLGRLLGGLGADVCGRARLFVLGTCADGGRELRRTAAEHGLRTLRFGAGLAPARPEARRPAPAESAQAPTESGPAPVASAPAAEVEPEPDHERDPMSRGTLPEATPPETTPSRATEDPRPVLPSTRPSMVSTAPAPAPAARDTSAAPGEPATSATSATSGAGAGAGSPEPPRPRTGGPGLSKPPSSGRVRDPERPDGRGAAGAVGAAGVAAVARLSTTVPQSTQTPPSATAPGPATPEPPAPEPPAARTPTVPLRPLPPVPFLPGHVSTEAERTAFRALADAVWERHSAAVTRALTRMPALRGAEQEAARIDLIALHMYLDTSYDLDTPDAPDTPAAPLSHAALARGMRTGDDRLLPYAACVASALRRLPSYRGLACRRTHEADGGLVPGTLLRDPAPVCALPLAAGAPRPAGAQYAIWSVTGRRTRQLTGRPGSASGGDEVVFAPGTLLRVLDVRDTDGAPLVLLREVPTTASSPSAAGAVPQDTRLDDHDRAALDRLDEALRRHRPAATRG
ncbi:hypothetical protein [Streptomyces milbemycinicus]|uniref:hypothetical protein n=1 Tax=Streptomyces milbemycinicus TaxID=476552 RepID=UPI0033FCF45D